MKKLIVLLVLVAGILLAALLLYPEIPERFFRYVQAPVFGKSWQNEVDKQHRLYPASRSGLVFIGDSHMEQCEWNEMFPGYQTANRGIGGETIRGLLHRLYVLDSLGTPVVFLQTGINDLLTGDPVEVVFSHYTTLLDSLRSRSLAVVPTFVFPTRYNEEVNLKVSGLNQRLDTLFRSRGIVPVGINHRIAEGPVLKADFTLDGIHLNPAGYRIWAEAIRLRLASFPDSGSR
jgi:lysophospholipase L1-like esterase